MTFSTDADTSTLAERLAGELTRLLGNIELAAWAPVVAWAEESGLSLEDVRILLALDSQPLASAPALVIADVSGLSLDTVYRRLPALVAAGYITHDGNMYDLTDDGDLALEAIEAARRAGLRAYLREMDPEQQLLLEFFLR
jgi:DNA-binding MarR family transcriptional regulator